MKFKRIEFENHPILGNCVFDFTTKNGDIADTIIIAGENGCGKSVFLNELYRFEPNTLFNNKIGRMIVDAVLNEEEITKLNESEDIKRIKPSGLKSNEIQIRQDFSTKNNWAQSIFFIDGNQFYGHMLSNLFKRVYSDVEINFAPQKINSITAQNIDQIQNNAIKSSKNLATEITQLLIDIKTLDDADLASWVELHPGEVPPESIKSMRMKRFTNAFHSIFENKKFKGITNENGYKSVNFEEFGRIMSIDQLSSGEKQIVFRGSFLLKDKKSIEGAYVLVDEPEISLHPKWQINILPFIKNLFMDECGVQTSQIFVTTHSPFIIHNYNRSNDKVIILQKDNNGIIKVSDKPEYYSWTAEQIIQEAYDININFQPNVKYVFVEGETDEYYYKKTLEVFGLDQNKLIFNWIGRNLAKGKNENTGDTALNNAASFYKANPQMITCKQIILLYDYDTNKHEENVGNLIILKMQNNSKNLKYKKGVENLLNLPSDFNYEAFYKLTEKEDEYGGKSHIQKLDKTALCSYVCSLPNEQLKDIFKYLKNEIDRIFALPD